MKKSANFPLLFGTLIILLLIPALACTRTVSSPQELTEVADKVSVYHETAVVYESTAEVVTETAEAIITATAREHLALASQTAAAEAGVTLVPTETPTPTNTPVPTDTPTPTLTPRPTMRIETIAPEQPAGTVDPSLPTATEAAPLPEISANFSSKHFYVAQTGDTADAVAFRYGTDVSHIAGLEEGTDTSRFLKPGTTLLITAPQRTFADGTRILPDEYIVMGYPSIEYDLEYEVQAAGGYLAAYTEDTSAGKLTGTEIIRKVALDYSISPIILMELLEYKSHWVYGSPHSIVEEHYPLGWLGENSSGLYKQMVWAAQELSKGYYGWRYGTLSEIPFYKNPQPSFPIYFNPLLNAGSAAIQYLFAQLYPYDEFEEAIYGENGFLQQFYLDFGNVWDSYIDDPNGFNDRLTQPALTLPFSENDEWCITGGPHESWTTGSPLGALDFAPRMAQEGCAQSDSWITASAPGLVIRTGTGTVVLDLDMDGHEETGWVIYYLHVETRGRVEEGTTVPLHGRIGHPSCEGGNATGTHLHIARKYNGEWVNAYGPIPFDMSGWIPFGGTSYKGGISRDGDTIYAQTYASSETLVHY